MSLTEPRPTADQLNEARLMLTNLERLFEAGGEDTYAAIIRKVLHSDEPELKVWLTSGDFWGGMGSMIDSAFCTPTARGPEVDRRNRREFMSLIVKLGKHQMASGIFTANIKPHIEKWTNTFQGWLDSNLV
ncbi:MAG: hypothetical protein WAU82_22750 [Candidatus Binatus sp.]|uniref:hypothetical protein n=2 Tax=Candidatus Binatus sp. TaxID=2811406 RepID=UPI003BB0B577